MDNQKKQILEEKHETLVRISGYDLPGSRKIYSGLTRIKGVSWCISKIICKKLNLSINGKISELDKKKVNEIEEELKSLEIPNFLKNRAQDISTGEAIHLSGIKLEMARECDIKRLRQIKSYRGTRHALKLPVRGQRTRSNFRKSGVSMGVKRKK